MRTHVYQCSRMERLAMAEVLYIEASPRKTVSASIRAANVFLSALQRAQPNVAIDRLDLWNEQLPEFSGSLIAAKYAQLKVQAMNLEETEAWNQIRTFVARLVTADAVVIATPIWNFGIPYKLKHWIDLITQPNLSFSFDPNTGYSPLLKSKPTLVILSSAGDYARGTSYGRPDLATPYLRAALCFVGLCNVTFESVAPTSGSSAIVEHAQRRAAERLEGLSVSFLGLPQ
jgi:FMN-dependent NADH-azoreductase